MADYTALGGHQGDRHIFWCGSDIRVLEDTPFWQKRVAGLRAKHFCENEAEQQVLKKMGIQAQLAPMLFDDSKLSDVSAVSQSPHVYMCVHPGREAEYGLYDVVEVAQSLPEFTFHIYGEDQPATLQNIVSHGKVSNDQFNREIEQYQAAIRFNKLDGFSEVLAKSALLGQYPLSRIPYPHIDSFKTNKELIHKLKALKTKTRPNTEGKAYWTKRLKLSHDMLLDFK